MNSLYNKSDYLFIAAKGNRSFITIGAPHHAVGGIKELPCHTHKDADENTGFIARRIAELLDCNYAITCNMRVDANKSLDTDYYKQLIAWETRYLIEIHGHGAKNASVKSIEISCGQTCAHHAASFANDLHEKLSHTDLKGFSVSGDYSKIYFKARNTASVNDDRWLTYHIELPPALRKDEHDRLPSFADIFARAAVDTIKHFCIKKEKGEVD